MVELETPKEERDRAQCTHLLLSFPHQLPYQSHSAQVLKLDSHTSVADNRGTSQHLDVGWVWGEWLAPFLLA